MSRQNLAKSTFWLIVSEIIFNLSGYVIHSFVGRILGPADYGRYGLVVTLTTMVIILIGNGIPTAMSKYISEVFETNPSMVLAIKKQAAILQTILIGSITILFFFSAPLISSALGDPSLTSLFRVSALIIPSFAAASFYFSFYTGLHKFNVQSILKTLRSVMKVLAIVGLAWAFKVPGSILGYALAAFSVFLIAFSLDRLKYTKELKEAAKSQNLSLESSFETKKLLNYAWQVIIFFLAYELLISIDLYLVKGILRDDYLTGIYNASLTVGRIPYYIFYALTIMLLPVVSKSTSENNQQQASAVVKHSLRLMLVLLVPSVVTLSLYAKQILTVFYGKGYEAAALPMSILAYGVGFLTVFYVLSFVLNGAGKTRAAMFIATGGFAINTLLNYFLIKCYGLIGSAIATSITSTLVAIIIFRLVVKDFGRLLEKKTAWKIILASFHMFIFQRFLPDGHYTFLISITVLFGIYFLFLFILREITAKDLHYLKSLLGNKKKKNEIKEEFSGNEPSA